MPDMNDDIEQDVAIGETVGDREPSLSVDNVTIAVSRLKVGEDYITKLWMSRKVRRFYAIGLLTEALQMLTSSNTAEVVWCNDTPDCINEEEIAGEDEGDDFTNAST